MSAKPIILSVLLLVALVLFGWSCFRRFRIIALGKPENRFRDLDKRLISMLLYAFAQRRVVSRRFGLNHFVLFWCFLILLAANAEFLLNPLFPDYISLSRLPDGAHFALAVVFDLISELALMAVVVALIRRAAFAPPHIGGMSRDAVTILALVAILMIAFFGLHGSQIAQGNEAAYRPVSGLVAAAFFADASPKSLAGLASFFWWLHVLVLLGFLNYLPYSKHMHILTAIPNCFFRNLVRVNVPPREKFAKSISFGVGQVDQFTWKGLFDSYSCTECGRCSDACPATFTGKPLDPQRVMHDIKINLLSNGPALVGGRKAGLPLIGGGKEGSIDEEVIWECTTCGACVEVCPVFIEQFPRIIDMRRNLVEIQARFPKELLNFFENMEQRGNPWGIASAERVKWAAEIKARSFEADKIEYLFFVGCAGAFDARNRRTTRAIARILDASGVSWGILGREEPCCADSLRRLGNEYVFDLKVKQNIKLFQERGVKKVITQCPHCYSTLKNDYSQYGVALKVHHHTELIHELVRKRKLGLDKAVDMGKVVFHDSCYLGRYNQIYQAPRSVIASATGQPPTEMDYHHSRSFCCGGGGGRLWMEESIGENINVTRVEEALRKNPQTICVSCPYCMLMFEDGLKDKNALNQVRILDLAEIVAEVIT